MKKFSAILLALVLVLAMSAPAMAASITITPPATEGSDTGITYTAYKIFDATISGEAVAYTIESSSVYFDTVKNSEYFTLTPSAGSTTTYVVTATEKYDEDAANTFADTLKAVPGATAAGTFEDQEDGTYKIENLANGYYLVTSSVGSDLILKTIGDVKVKTKNEYPTIEKEVKEAESATANMGDILTFTINVTIPEDAVGEIVVHDKMTGLVYQSMTEVAGITASTENADNCAVEFTLTAEYVAANKGKGVTITYTAKVTADVANNEAWLVDDTYTSKSDNTPVYSTDIVIKKIAKKSVETEADTLLAGAKFVLKNTDGKFYAVDEDGNVRWVADQGDATVVVTGTDGTAKFENIADGTYWLVETEAPAGYNLLTKAVEVVVKATTKTENDKTTVVDVTATVENSTGSELPSTGGIGTTIFYVVGGLMMAAAVVLLVSKKMVAAGK